MYQALFSSPLSGGESKKRTGDEASWLYGLTHVDFSLTVDNMPGKHARFESYIVGMSL